MYAGVKNDAYRRKYHFDVWNFCQESWLPSSVQCRETVTGNISSPDVPLISRKSLTEDELPEGFMDGAPDLTIDVISLDDWADPGRKIGEYFMLGTKGVCPVDPMQGDSDRLQIACRCASFLCRMTKL